MFGSKQGYDHADGSVLSPVQVDGNTRFGPRNGAAMAVMDCQWGHVDAEHAQRQAVEDSQDPGNRRRENVKQVRALSNLVQLQVRLRHRASSGEARAAMGIQGMFLFC